MKAIHRMICVLGATSVVACSGAEPPTDTPKPAPAPTEEQLKIETGTAYDQVSMNLASLSPVLAFKDNSGFRYAKCAVHKNHGISYVYRRLPDTALSAELTDALGGSLSIPLEFLTIKAGANSASKFEYGWERTGAFELSRIPSKRELDGTFPECSKTTHAAYAVFVGASYVRRKESVDGGAALSLLDAGVSAAGSQSSQTALLRGKIECPTPDSEADCKSPVSWTLVPLAPDLGANCVHVAADQSTCTKCEQVFRNLRSHRQETVAQVQCSNLARDTPLYVHVEALVEVHPRYDDHVGQQNWAALEVAADRQLSAQPKLAEEYNKHGLIAFKLDGKTSTTDGMLNVRVSTPRCTKGDDGSQCVISEMTVSIIQR